MNELMMKELEDPETLLIARLPLEIKRFAGLCNLFERGEAVVKAMPTGCQWAVIKKAKGKA
jgi:hypothetical protein